MVLHVVCLPLSFAPFLVQEQNDALENDALETIKPETMSGLKELGACGLQIPQDLGTHLVSTVS